MESKEIGWYVYVIKSVVDKRLYVGMAMDVAKRLNEHNAGKTSSTRGVSNIRNCFNRKL
jgi:predicted GIY-YIG superfamily endonuclease